MAAINGIKAIEWSVKGRLRLGSFEERRGVGRHQASARVAHNGKCTMMWALTGGGGWRAESLCRFGLK
jgi:hypothetical protein